MIAALASIDPSALSSTQKRALALLEAPGIKLYRNAGKWGRTGQSITLDVAASLQLLGLARIDRSGREAQLVMTHAGQLVQAVRAERAGRRA